jgi:Tfp pilus assembly protein PilF
MTQPVTATIKQGNLDAYNSLAAVLIQQGHKNKAIEQLRSALQIDPNAVEIRRAMQAILKTE